MPSRLLRGLALVVVGAGCVVPEGGDPDGYVGPSQALFEVPRGAPPPSGFYALPYPNDLRIDERGRIDLGDYRRPNEIIGLYVDAIAEQQRGFSLSGAGFFRFTHPIDEGSLPTAPASTAEDAAVYLVDVDPDSPERGARTPVRLRFEHYGGVTIGDDWLSVLPYPGFPLREGTTYAMVVTRRVRATDGSPVGVAPDFAAIAAPAPAAEPALARAQAMYQPLWDWLDEPGGDERDDVVAAAVFTTQEVTRIMAELREVVWAQEAPVAREVVARQVAPAEAEILAWYDALYEAPNFQAGEPPYASAGGDIQRDPDTGAPIIQRWETLRVSFTVPVGAMPAAGWPVVLYAHGTGGSYHSFRNDGTARRLAAEGLAVISIDQVLHGPRVPAGTSPEIAFFNFQNPLAARDNTLQGALDNFQLLRLVRGFEHTDEEAGRTIRFDPARIYFFGHSQGGLTGPPFLAYEPEVGGAVLSGAGGLLYLSMILKTEPVDIAGIVGAFIRDYPLDEFNPVLALLQGYMDRADPVSYGPLLVRRPVPGIGPKHIFQSEGLVDRFTPPASIEALATAIAAHPVAPILAEVPGLALRELEVLEAPVAGNRAGTTSVLLQYEEAAGSDGHFVVFDVPAARLQSARFLGSLAADGVATVVPAP